MRGVRIAALSLAVLMSAVALAGDTDKAKVTAIDKYYDGEAHRVTIDFPYLLSGTGTAFCLERSRCTGLEVGTEVVFVKLDGSEDTSVPDKMIAQKNLRFGDSPRPVCSLLCTTDPTRGMFGRP